MPGLGRIGDIGNGVCPCHISPVAYVTVLNTGSADVMTNALGSAQIGSIGIASCGHPTVAQSGASALMINDLPAHRLGDTGSNCGPYVLNTGSGDVINDK